EPSTSIGSTNDIEIENIDFVIPIQFTSTPVQVVPIVGCNQTFNLNDIESYTLPSVEENSNTEVLTDHLSGRRIVYVDYIFKQIQNSSHVGGLDCSFLNMSFVSEKRYGFFSKFKFQCKMCNIVTATIIGYKTKKVLFVGIRNRFCIICSRAETKNEIPGIHTCFLNWKKAATGIEADGIAEGFLKSVELHKLKFNKLISDGDSSVTKRLKEILPYGPGYIVQKIECRNHMLRNYIQKLTFIAKKTNYPIKLRQFILKNILKFRTAIVTAIRHRKNENFFARPKALNCNLSADLFNSPYHIFGEHSKCDDYFCKKRLLEEENWVQRAEICGMMVEIKNIVNRLVINSASLILDVDNNICEQFNSIINKYIGGKRINLSQRNSYNTRVEAAVVSFNSKEYLRAIHKNVMKKSPGKFKTYNARSRELFPSKNKKINKKCSGPDENYGLADELVDDLTPTEFKIRKDNFLNELKTINREKLENETKDQSKSQL
ncbi:YqaJ domain-containing protein, partial [Aphis craccivora]